MLIWGLIRLICLKPVEETYDKGSAFKMFKVRKSSRAVRVVVTPFKHSKSGGNSEVRTSHNPICYVFFSITFSVAGMKCKMLQRTYLFL